MATRTDNDFQDLAGEIASAEQAALDEALLVATVPDYGQFQEVDAASRAQVIADLIAQGANPNAVNPKNGNTPLCHAILRRDPALIDLILDLGASIEPFHHNLHHTPPLHLAAWQGDTGMLDLLLRRGAVLDHADDTGRTALFAAAMNDQGEAMRMLVARGLDVHAVNHAGHSALDCLALRTTTGWEEGEDWRTTIGNLLALYPPAEQMRAIDQALAVIDDPARQTRDRAVEREIYRTRQYLLDLRDKRSA